MKTAKFIYLLLLSTILYSPLVFSQNNAEGTLVNLTKSALEELKIKARPGGEYDRIAQSFTYLRENLANIDPQIKEELTRDYPDGIEKAQETAVNFLTYLGGCDSNDLNSQECKRLDALYEKHATLVNEVNGAKVRHCSNKQAQCYQKAIQLTNNENENNLVATCLKAKTESENACSSSVLESFAKETNMCDVPGERNSIHRICEQEQNQCEETCSQQMDQFKTAFVSCFFHTNYENSVNLEKNTQCQTAMNDILNQYKENIAKADNNKTQENQHLTLNERLCQKDHSHAIDQACKVAKAEFDRTVDAGAEQLAAELLKAQSEQSEQATTQQQEEEQSTVSWGWGGRKQLQLPLKQKCKQGTFNFTRPAIKDTISPCPFRGLSVSSTVQTTSGEEAIPTTAQSNTQAIPKSAKSDTKEAIPATAFVHVKRAPAPEDSLKGPATEDSVEDGKAKEKSILDIDFAENNPALGNYVWGDLLDQV